MWTKTLTRDDLLELLQARGVVVDGVLESSRIVGGGQAQVIWRQDPRQYAGLPAVIVIDEGKQREFLAWAASYLHDLSPLTAFCRVIDTSSAERALRYKAIPSLGMLEEVCLGVIFAEALSHARARLERFSVKELTGAACVATYSFSMARALAVGALGPESDPITEVWERARTAARQPTLKLSARQAREVWAIVVALGRSEDDLFEVEGGKGGEPRAAVTSACLDLYRRGEISSAGWAALVGRSPELIALRDRMRDSVEDRVRAVERALEQLQQGGGANPTASGFVAGYLASRVAPGSLDHFDLLWPQVDRFPLSPLWYGLCAGLDARRNPNVYVGAVGRRVAREVLRAEALTDTPRCDIAIAELVMLTSGEAGSGDLRIGAHGFAEVELVPCVATTIRLGARGQQQKISDLPGTPRGDDDRSLGGELRTAIGRLDAICGRLERLAQGEVSAQPERKRRRR